jgi:VWFA-related protein
MLRFFGCSLITVLVCVPVGAAGQSISAESAPTIRSTSELVVVDVVATDAQQNPVHHLSASDFTISEDGHPQTIKVFEEHTASTSAQLPPLPKFAPGKFTNYSVAPANGALNIILLDKLNTPLNAQSVVRDQVLKYLKESPAGTRMAIFALTTQLRLLQGFTSDPEVLRELVAGKKGLPGSSPLMTNGADIDNSILNGIDSANNDIFGNSPDVATVMSSLQQFEAEQQSFQLMLRARYTLDAFNQLARYLSSLPGRKNLIWFSGSFPFSIMPDADLQDPFAAVASSEDEFRATVNLLARSQVAVYPIDARQLMTEPMLNAASSGGNFVKNPIAAETKFYSQTGNEHSTMDQMAEATGGKAFVNTNDLKTAISKAIESGSNYYTLAYAPTNQNQNGNYRKIEVKLDHSGVKLAYRRGYYADEPSTAKHPNETQSALTTSQPPYDSLRTAMLHGAPDPVEITFIADVRPSSMDTEPALAPGNQAEPKISGPYRRYTVTFVMNPKDLKCDVAPDGKHHCDMEFLTYVYDADSVLVNMQMNGINAALSPDRYAAFLKSPLAYRQQISVPVKGEYYLRLGLRDDTADHVGALELPIASVAKLPPASVTEPASGSKPAPK